MLYSEIIAVFSQIHTKHINTLCGQNVESLNVKLAVRIVTTGLLTDEAPRTHEAQQAAGSFTPQPLAPSGTAPTAR